ncbi:hypothetical protein J6A34_09260 [bacterium]|nr:hypothetical protein [bacterium]
MINKVSNITFTGYKQNFTDEEFKHSIEDSTTWAKDNINNQRYLLPKKLMDMQLEREAKRASSILEQIRTTFKAHEMEPMLELSIKENELIGNISYYNVRPVEVRTQMPRNLKSFFKKLIEIAKTQIEVDKLERQIWNIVQNEKYTKGLQNVRYKELMQEDQKLSRTIVLLFDPKYSLLTDKLLELEKEKHAVMELLKPLKKKLADVQFKFKIK